jgi:shikimate dehydrogenase
MAGVEASRCAVLGSPVEHSLSPALHRAAYRHLGLDWQYDAIRVEEDELAAFVAGLGPQWRGLSLTMPLKRAAAALADSSSEVVQLLGVANTLLLRAGGRHAENTDVTGIRAALAEQGVGWVGSAAVLGGGSTATSAVAALAAMTDHVVVCVRSPQRTGSLEAVAEAVGIRLDVVPWDQARTALSVPVVVAATPAGTADPLAAVVPARPGVLLDVIYHPWPTRLGQAWGDAGGAVAGGLDLLVHQAAEQVRLMTGRDVPIPVLREAGRQAMAAR